jgi:regulator of protease activity HflC (stomatin/prohibitin superfamily)
MSTEGPKLPPFLKQQKVPNPPNIKPGTFGKIAALAVVAIIAINLVGRSFASVDANEIGIEIVRGKVQGTLAPGWHFISPIGGKVEKFSTRIQQTSMLRGANDGDRAGDDSIEAASAEGATLSVDLTVNYRLKKTDAVKLFNNILSEDDLRERIVRPGVRSVTRDVFAKYNAREAITSKRGDIQLEIARRLNERFSTQGLEIETVDVRELYLPINLQEQVNQAIAAEAAGQRVAIERKQKETEAETARLVAEKTADQLRISAQGEADARTINAKAEAEANKVIANSLTPGLIQLRQIEAVYKNGNQVYFLPQGASPNIFLTPSTNLGSAQVGAAGAAAVEPVPAPQQ